MGPGHVDFWREEERCFATKTGVPRALPPPATFLRLAHLITSLLALAVPAGSRRCGK